jgi:NTP pyrophosphatase (non-canonical NTP hydrolase)
VEQTYIQKALRTESTVFNVEAGDDRLLHAGIGLATESAEFLDQLKKHVFYGKPLDKVNLREELGDMFWYMAIACDALEVTFEELQDRNIAKLTARYPEKFTMEAAEHRDLEAERAILEEK